MNQIIIPCGYMGSGSSAITDLLSELDGYEAPNGSFEYVFMHCPNGVFDLEDKLLKNNTVVRSDEAIRSFELEMKDLYSTKNYWPGYYKHFLSKSFMDYVEEFIDDIQLASFTNCYWYYQQKPDGVWMQIKLYVRKLVSRLTKGKIKLDVPLRYKEMRIAFPTPEEFYDAARAFIYKIIATLGGENKNIILDQLLLPHNIHRAHNYFGDVLKVIVVDRDPRDVFMLNKYVWARDKVAVPFPTDPHLFAMLYKEIRKSEHIIENDCIIRVHFEDLIYKYNDTLNRLYAFLGTNASLHSNKGGRFNPDRSIVNTQLFNIKDLNDEQLDEIRIISEELKEYLYEFPDINIERQSFATLF